jgi:transcriptional regulator with XRE-family HTH domain
MSQEELAFAVGYKTKASINKIEKNQSTVPHSKLVRISQVLNVPIDNLVGGKTYTPHSQLVASTEQYKALDLAIQNTIEYNEAREILKRSEEAIQKNQKVYEELKRLAKRFQNDTPQQQKDKDLIFKYHQITPEHQKTITDMLNGFYQLDSQIQKNATTADSDGEDSGTQKGTPSLQ